MRNYTLEINSFLFRRAWGVAFKELPDEAAGKLIRAIYQFTDGEEIDLEDPKLKSLFEIITSQLNDSAKKYVCKYLS